MLTVFSNVKFLIFLVLLSSFYMMFWQLFYALPFYVLEVLHYENFELLETVNAWVIIGVSIPIGILIRRWSPLQAIISGLLLASCSWLCFAIAPTIPAALLGITLFAIGEAALSPRLYEYVATLAPKNQVGTYMGFAFLPVAIGSFAGGPLGGYLVQKYLRETYQPEMIWYTVASIGLVSSLLLIVYAAAIHGRSEDSEMQAELAS